MRSIVLVLIAGCASPTDPGTTHPTLPSADKPGEPSDAASFVPSEASSDPPQMVFGGIFANTYDRLYQFDPVNQTLTLVGPFSGCSDGAQGGVGVMDIAIDSQGNAYATDYGHQLSKLDLKTGACTAVKWNMGLNVNGIMPNESLSFVPKGTLDPNGETLVAFLDAQWIGNQFLETYARWDTSNGAYTQVAQNGDFEQVTDVVTVAQTSFAIANHPESTNFPVCMSSNNDCVLEIDPKTGTGIKAIGIASGAPGIEGLAFWAGILYGFDAVGGVWSIAWQNNQLVTTKIPVNISNLHFFGAASSPGAPATQPDGGGIPIH